MFVQIIEGRVSDRGGIESERERWEEKLLPSAEGFVGSTGGITADGRLVLVARFESEQAARRSSERPEQSEWWRRFSSHLAGEATFHESSDITTYQGGGDDR